LAFSKLFFLERAGFFSSISASSFFNRKRYRTLGVGGVDPNSFAHAFPIGKITSWAFFHPSCSFKLHIVDTLVDIKNVARGTSMFAVNWSAPEIPGELSVFLCIVYKTLRERYLAVSADDGDLSSLFRRHAVLFKNRTTIRVFCLGHAEAKSVIRNRSIVRIMHSHRGSGVTICTLIPFFWISVVVLLQSVNDIHVLLRSVVSFCSSIAFAKAKMSRFMQRPHGLVVSSFCPRS